ncbi:MAG: hypothetical protein R3F43_02770 [bacterium]
MTRQCAALAYSCDGDFFVLSSAGQSVFCGGYRCVAGTCWTTCGSNLDCKQDEGYQCQDGRCVR